MYKCKIREDANEEFVDDIAYLENLGIDSKNIARLSGKELCNFWNKLHSFLLDIKRQLDLKTGDALIDHKESLQLINSIAKLALNAISSHDFIPTDLTEIVLLLNLLFSQVSNNQVKDTISCLLEKWWILKLDWHEKIVLNAITFLVQQSKNSVHIKRLHAIKDALILISEREDIIAITKLLLEKCVLSTTEVREIIAELFRFGKVWIMTFHEHIKETFEYDSSNIKTYADIYIEAYINATVENKSIIEEKCLEDLIFYSLRSKRTVKRDKLRKNLLLILKYFHASQNLAIKQAIYNLYNELLWNHLKAPGSLVRCNAAEVLFIAFPLLLNGKQVKNNKLYLKKQYNAMSELLMDENNLLCVIAVKGVFGLNWNVIPDNIIKKWLEIMVDLIKTRNDQDLRIEIFQGLKLILQDTKLTRETKLITENMEKMKLSVYDPSNEVKIAFLDLLLFVTNHTCVKFWNIVPLSCILDGIEETTNKKIINLSVKLLQAKLLSNESISKSISDIVRFGIVNQDGMRQFFLHSKDAIDCKTAFSYVKVILLEIVEQIQNHLKEKDEKEDSNADIKCPTQLSTLSMLLLESSVLMLHVRLTELSNIKYQKEINDITDIISENDFEFCWLIKNSSCKECAIFFISLLPKCKIKNYNSYIVTCIEELKKKHFVRDTVYRVLDLLIKWEHIEDIFQLLLKMLDVNSEQSEKLLGLQILNVFLSSNLKINLLKEHHKEMTKFWMSLDFIKDLAESNLSNKNPNQHSETLEHLFSVYVSLIDTLHKNNSFDATHHFSILIKWALRTIVSQISDSVEPDLVKFPVAILKSIFHTGNTLISFFKVFAKLCYDIVFLYYKCLITPVGVVFINDALVTLWLLLNYNKSIFKENEAGIEDVVAPRLWALLMIVLTKNSEESLINYTNDLQDLQAFLPKLFTFFDYTSVHSELYMSVIFNTAVASLSKELMLRLNNNSLSEYIQESQFPYVTEKIISFLFDGHLLQKLCFQTLDNMILNYNNIDELSVLLILHQKLSTRKDLLKEVERIYTANEAKLRDDENDVIINKSINSMRRKLLAKIM